MAERVVAEDEEGEGRGGGEELDADQKVSHAKWFLLNAPPEEIQQVAADVRELLSDASLYDRAVGEAFPQYNVEQMIALEMPNGTGKVLVTRFAQLDRTRYLDPRTAQVATVDHVNQVCNSVEAASDDDLPSGFVEEYRAAVDSELVKYVEEAFPRGACSVYCTRGKDAQDGAEDFELTAAISNSSFSSKNYRGGRWRSIWRLDVHVEGASVNMSGKLSLPEPAVEVARGVVEYNGERRLRVDPVLSQAPGLIYRAVLQNAKEAGVSIVSVIRNQESEYLNSLADIYTKLSDSTFKELRRKLPVTRTQFSWNKALQLSLTREAARQASSSRHCMSDTSDG